MIYTFQFSFHTPNKNDNDETEFCASNFGEALTLFKDFLEDEGINFYKIDYEWSVVYSKDDAEVYGDEYANEQDIEDFCAEVENEQI